MTEVPFALEAPRRSDRRLVAAVSTAHFVSHYYILALPPLLEIIRADFRVSYTELGFAMVAFNVVCAAFQTPAGFWVDRIGPRRVLMAGLVVSAVALAAAGLVASFWVFVALFALGGLGNAVYHPADYAALSNQVAPERIGRAYAMHAFAGMMGGAAAPVVLVMLEHQIGWRGAFVASAIPGLAVALWFAALGEDALPRHPRSAPAEAAPESSRRLLTSPPILINFLYFALFATVQVGMQSYGAVALTGAWGTPLSVASAGLTGYLLFNAFGVLLGGVPAGKISPALLATLALLVTCAFAVALAVADLGSVGAVLAMSAAGLAAGISMPSRDLIVRAVTPPGTFGKVFGFVTTGFNLAGVVTPVLFGLLMDHGHPSAVFVVVAVACLLAIGAVIGVRAKS